MPIYAYKCSACGHAQDVMQKVSDAPLTVCPACGASAYAKQVTAAGFQLKGSGWYVTDFRDKGSKAADSKADSKPTETKTETKSDSASTAISSPSPSAGNSNPSTGGS